MSSTLENLAPLFPLDFFSVTADVPYAKKNPAKKIFKKGVLPDHSEFLNEGSFGQISIFWNEQALLIEAEIDKPFEESLFPEYRQGDSLELFIDTRDLKTAGFVTRFCHHFVFLPEEAQGIKAQEVTYFRVEDSHPLCDSSELFVETTFKKTSYRMEIVIPATCLHAFDPSSFKRLGFSYRINRYKGEPQNFALSSKYYVIEKHPHLWASLNLKDEK